MPEGMKVGRNLPSILDEFPNKDFFERETEMLKILDSLSEQIRLLENKEATTDLTEEFDCDFKDTCYVAKSKMGPCPCELYR